MERFVIKSVWGTYWNDGDSNWGNSAIATEYGKYDLPVYLDWEGPDGMEELLQWDFDGGYYYEGDDSPTASIVRIE